MAKKKKSKKRVDFSKVTIDGPSPRKKKSKLPGKLKGKIKASITKGKKTRAKRTVKRFNPTTRKVERRPASTGDKFEPFSESRAKATLAANAAGEARKKAKRLAAAKAEAKGKLKKRPGEKVTGRGALEEIGKDGKIKTKVGTLIKKKKKKKGKK